MAAKPTEISATEIELKRRGRRRLIGAVTLGLLAIVFLPMIFDSEPKRAGNPMKTQEIAVQIPPKEGQPPLPAPSVAPIVDAPAPEPAKPAVAADASVARESAAVAPPPAIAAPRETVKEPVKEPAKESPPAKAEKPAKTAKTAEADSKGAEKKGFAVQLGVFNSAENARHAIDKMKEAKLPVYTETIPIKTGDATRVRVGPFATREKADAAMAQIKLAGADGKIVPLNK